MGTIADGQKTGYGLLKLRGRFIRRAEHLVSDPGYIAATNGVRSRWNSSYPRYFLTGAGSSPEPTVPRGLDNDLNEHDREASRIEEKYADTLDRPRNLDSDEEYDDYFREVDSLTRRFPQLYEAYENWMEVVHRLSEYFFPSPYFDFPGGNRPAPATSGFLGASICTHPRLLVDIPSLFPELTIPVHAHGYASEVAEGLYVPLFPGMSAEDLIRSASAIADQANEYYADRTPPGLVLSLKSKAYTHKQIAEQLGLTPQTVAATLKNTGFLTTRKP